MDKQTAIPIRQISTDEQEKILSRKLDERLAIFRNTDPSVPMYEASREMAKELCANDFCFFADNFIIIQDPESDDINQKELPFLLYDYQEQAAREIIKAIVEGYDLPIEKTRKMGLSWLLMAIFVWGWHFKQWDLLCGSQKFENVDKRGNIKSLLEKARFIIYRLPPWMFPLSEFKPLLHDKTGILLHPSHGASITGEANNTNFGRSDRRKAILFDEFSSWEQTDEAAWQSCSSTTKCRIPLSTPNTRGTNCHFFKITSGAHKNNRPILRLHWTLNPIFASGLSYDELGKPTSPWYRNEIERCISQQEVAQELDIDYEASMGSRVFPDFSLENNVVAGLVYDENLPLYGAIDFGLDQTAILWIQPDLRNKTINIIDEYVNDGKNEGTDIYHYINIIESKPYKRAIFFGDPHSGENRSLTSGDTNANALRRHGIIVRSKLAKIVERIGAGRNLVNKVRVSDCCPLTVEMFLGWQFIKPKTGNVSSQTPKHDNYCHLGDAYTYFAINFSNYNQNIKKKSGKKFKASISGVV